MYIFQLGRDADISTLEIIRVLQSLTGEMPQIARYDNYLLLLDDIELDCANLLNQLAGTIKLASIFYTSEIVDSRFIDLLEFYYPKNFEIFVNSENVEVGKQVVGLLNDFKKQIKTRGSITFADNSKIKPFGGEYETQKDRVCEVIILKNNDNYHFAKVEAYADNSEFKFKDEARPVQKFTHGTSPRLAKMMVNILALEPGEVLVDPFCGIGTFLIEGMIAGLSVIGIDNDSGVVSSAKNNVAWARKAFGLKGQCKIILGDSTIEAYKADGCVFEPYMGPFMKKLPSYAEASKVKDYLEKLYAATFNNLSHSLSEYGEVVCIIPYFKTNDGNFVRINTSVFTDFGFEAELDPIEYNTPEGSKIQRQLWLLQKQGV